MNIQIKNSLHTLAEEYLHKKTKQRPTAFQTNEAIINLKGFAKTLLKMNKKVEINNGKKHIQN